MPKKYLGVLTLIPLLLLAACTADGRLNLPTLPPQAPAEATGETAPGAYPPATQPAGNLPPGGAATEAPYPPASADQPAATVDSAAALSSALGAGDPAEAGEAVSDTFILETIGKGMSAVKSKTLGPKGDKTHVFEFPDERTRTTVSNALTSLARQKPAGMPAWAQDSYVWARGRLLVSYPGEQKSTVRNLTRLLGSPLLQPGVVPTAGVTPTTPVTPNGPNALANTRWRLVSYGAPGSETPVIAGTNLTLDFNTAGQAGGIGSCNAYTAAYQAQGTQLTVTNLNTVPNACSNNALIQQDQAFLSALSGSQSFEINGTQLAIYSNNGQGVLRLEARP